MSDELPKVPRGIDVQRKQSRFNEAVVDALAHQGRMTDDLHKELEELRRRVDELEKGD